MNDFVKIPEPKNADEYVQRFKENQHFSGFGLGNVMSHCPCPFCAAPDIKVYNTMEILQRIGEEAVCKHCDRGYKGSIMQDGNGTTYLSFVQTRGPDQPDWLVPKMPRES